MAIITISHQHGSGGDAVAADVAQRLGFRLITPGKVDEIIKERYQLDFSLSGAIQQTPRGSSGGKVFANLISAILTDMAVLDDLVVLECGGQFIFRAFPNALHVRIISPREQRLHALMRDTGIPFAEAQHLIEEHERRHMRFLRSSFHRTSDTPERYDIVVNTGLLGTEHAVDIVLHAVRLKKLSDYGIVAGEKVEHLRLRNRIRLLRALTKLSLDNAQPLAQFAHPSELVFARLLDFYGIKWQYEPRTFPLKYDDRGNIVEAFAPDFYLPDSDLFVELTTMKQSLVTKKNRKVKRLRELFPDIKIRLLYQKDFEDLIFKYSAGKQAETT